MCPGSLGLVPLTLWVPCILSWFLVHTAVCPPDTGLVPCAHFVPCSAGPGVQGCMAQPWPGGGHGKPGGYIAGLDQAVSVVPFHFGAYDEPSRYLAYCMVRHKADCQ